MSAGNMKLNADISSPWKGEDQGGGLKQFRELSPVIVKCSRKLRTEMTEAEKKLWYHLQRRQLGGHKFRRQRPVGKYIVDFACIERNLIVELDGGQHALQENYDKQRDEYIRKQEYEVLRFWNNEVLKNIEYVLSSILGKLENDPHPASPFQREERMETNVEDYNEV